MADKIYTLFTPKLEFSFDSWTEDVGICGEFNYWPKLSSGSDPDSFITLDSTTRTFSIVSSDYSKRGVYSLRVHGKSINFPSANEAMSNIF